MSWRPYATEKTKCMWLALFLCVLQTTLCSEQKEACSRKTSGLSLLSMQRTLLRTAKSDRILSRVRALVQERVNLTANRRFQPGEHCNTAAAHWHFSERPVRWKVPKKMRDLCRRKHRKHGIKHGHRRNWCWVAIKHQCKKLDKVKQPWSEVWKMARENDGVPKVLQERFDPLEHPEICDHPSSGRSVAWTPTEWQESHAWLKQHVAVYVLNLATDTKRWQTVHEQLQKLGVSATRIEGVDLQKPGSLIEATQSGWIPDSFDMKQAERHCKRHAKKNKKKCGLRGTAGCASGHFKAQIQAHADGFPVALVLEDDSAIQDDFVPRLWSMLKTELPCDWDVVSLNSKCPFGRCVSKQLARVQPDFNEREQDCHFGVNFGTHGLLYRTERLPSIRRLMQNSTFNVMRPKCMDIDVALAAISNRLAYYAVPAVQFPSFLRHNTEFPSRRAAINKKRHSRKKKKRH